MPPPPASRPGIIPHSKKPICRTLVQNDPQQEAKAQKPGAPSQDHPTLRRGQKPEPGQTNPHQEPNDNFKSPSQDHPHSKKLKPQKPKAPRRPGSPHSKKLTPSATRSSTEFPPHPIRQYRADRFPVPFRELAPTWAFDPRPAPNPASNLPKIQPDPPHFPSLRPPRRVLFSLLDPPANGHIRVSPNGRFPGVQGWRSSAGRASDL